MHKAACLDFPKTVDLKIIDWKTKQVMTLILTT